MFFSNFIPCHDYRYPYTSHVKNTRAGSSRLSIRHVIIQPCKRKKPSRDAATWREWVSQALDKKLRKN